MRIQLLRRSESDPLVGEDVYDDATTKRIYVEAKLLASHPIHLPLSDRSLPYRAILHRQRQTWATPKSNVNFDD
jgi:hypothetical protein